MVYDTSYLYHAEYNTKYYGQKKTTFQLNLFFFVTIIWTNVFFYLRLKSAFTASRTLKEHLTYKLS